MYCDRTRVEKIVGPENFALLLADDKDGVEDAGLFDVIGQDASDQVDGYLGGKYEVPFSGTVPAFVKRCVTVFACETLYKRRGISRDANPWTTDADALRKRLERISEGTEKLDLASDASGSAVEAQTEPSRIAQDGLMMF
jgi:phage gp36-like protein